MTSAAPDRPLLPDEDPASWSLHEIWKQRLQQLDSALSGHLRVGVDFDVDLMIERATLLDALDRRDDARQAFIDILRIVPTNFAALNEFGGFLVSIGAIAAACRVYEEAIAHHPENPDGHVNLANILLKANEYDKARHHYETALRISPQHPQAHQGLGAVLADTGDLAGAQDHFRIGFHRRAVVTQRYRGTKPPLALLQLVSSGGGNIPTACLLDDRTFLTTVVIADYVDPGATLPAHRAVFNTIGDADLCRPALQSAIEIIARSKAPVINDPHKVIRTGRIESARRLGALPGVKAPRIVMMPRQSLIQHDAADAVIKAGFSFPLLLRSPGYHTGRNFSMVQQAAELPVAAAELPGDQLLAIEYLDARGHDGNSRKFRVMFIDGVAYPLHLAISPRWKVHYFTADMADRADHRAEEELFLSDMRAALGDKLIVTLDRIRQELDLDYGGIDFGIDHDGELLLFEANPTMVLVRPDTDPRWNYRYDAINRAITAATEMIIRRAEG